MIRLCEGHIRTITYHLLFLFYGIKILRKIQRGDSLHIVTMITVIIVIVITVLVLACWGACLGEHKAPSDTCILKESK